MVDGSYDPGVDQAFNLSGAVHETTGVMRSLNPLINEDGILLVDGLIVDMTKGGIGLRNHSVPPASRYGSTWTEDILFIEPETVCVNLNITLDYMLVILRGDDWFLRDLVLTDRGGFTNFSTYPLYHNLENTQQDPQLFKRAQQSAVMNNFLTMAFLNVTNPNDPDDPSVQAFQYVNSFPGKTFQFWNASGVDLKTWGLKLGMLQTNAQYGDYLPETGPSDDRSSNPSNDNPLFTNPFGVDSSSFDFIGMVFLFFSFLKNGTTTTSAPGES